MPDIKPKIRSKLSRDPRQVSPRQFQEESLVLRSLRLIAAPDPEDDLSDEELNEFCKSPAQSPEMIQHLIEFIKTM